MEAYNIRKMTFYVENNIIYWTSYEKNSVSSSVLNSDSNCNPQFLTLEFDLFRLQLSIPSLVFEFFFSLQLLTLTPVFNFFDFETCVLVSTLFDSRPVFLIMNTANWWLDSMSCTFQTVIQDHFEIRRS